jgi:hypothetical protein
MSPELCAEWRMRHGPLLFALLLAACAHRAPVVPGAPVSSVLLAYDDGRPEGALTFPTLHHEGVVRFELPPGEHQLRRLWLQATAPGTLRWAIYEQTPLDGPGLVVSEGTFVVSMKQVSSGHDNLWLYADLSALPARDGVVWLGLKRTEGEPAIATSRIDAGQYYLRSDDPSNPLNLLPVKRTPLVRLEVAP